MVAPLAKLRPYAARRLGASALLVAGLVFSASPPLKAAEIEGVGFPASVSSGKAELPLFGLGLLRYRVFFRGYVGALYLPTGSTAQAALDDVPKALELYYFWEIPGRFFGEAASDHLERVHSAERVAALRGRLDRLHSMYRDVEPGDRYRLTYEPGRGTTLSHNGQPLGTIEGADFAADYFGLWLGADPLSESFRDELLSGSQRDD